MARKPKPFGEVGLRRIIYQYKRDAHKRGYTYELTNDVMEYMIYQPCHYCGRSKISILPSRKGTRTYEYRYNGIDRKDNNLGYVEGNVVTCCIVCNRAKHGMSYEDFITYLQHLVLFRLEK